MGHLVERLEGLTLDDCLASLSQAHSFLHECVKASYEDRFSHAIKKGNGWGSALKRVTVELPYEKSRRHFMDSEGKCHVLIGEDVPNQKFAEIVNQAASMERLMDAIRWARTRESGLSDYRVQICHPTTSSATTREKKVADDHDLVLKGSNDELAKFEVSDVAGKKDGNRKEEKDLVGLGFLKKGTGEAKFAVSKWPDGRSFLVVSNESSLRMRKPKRGWLHERTGQDKRIPPHLRFKEWPCGEETGIFEIERGPGFGFSPLCTGGE